MVSASSALVEFLAGGIGCWEAGAHYVSGGFADLMLSNGLFPDCFFPEILDELGSPHPPPFSGSRSSLSCVSSVN